MATGNYSKHAKIWDWSGYNRTSEFVFWSKFAGKYGKTVLSLMAAIGEVGAYLAQKDFNVTATDITKEMIEEGSRRFGHLPNLTFQYSDIRDFELDNKDYDFAFIGSTDLHHLQTEDDIRAALISIRKHLRVGGGLGLELWYPSNQSWKSPKGTFHPLSAVGDGSVKVWKEGETEYDAASKRVKISQNVFIQEGDKIENFIHEFEMYLFDREWFLKILEECGFSVKAEYGDYSLQSWNTDASKWIVEVVKA